MSFEKEFNCLALRDVIQKELVWGTSRCGSRVGGGGGERLGLECTPPTFSILHKKVTVIIWRPLCINIIIDPIHRIKIPFFPLLIIEWLVLLLPPQFRYNHFKSIVVFHCGGSPGLPSTIPWAQPPSCLNSWTRPLTLLKEFSAMLTCIKHQCITAIKYEVLLVNEHTLIKMKWNIIRQILYRTSYFTKF